MIGEVVNREEMPLVFDQGHSTLVAFLGRPPQGLTESLRSPMNSPGWKRMNADSPRSSDDAS